MAGILQDRSTGNAFPKAGMPQLTLHTLASPPARRQRAPACPRTSRYFIRAARSSRVPPADFVP